MAQLLDLPAELLMLICERLSHRELCRLDATCRALRAAGEEAWHSRLAALGIGNVAENSGESAKVTFLRSIMLRFHPDAPPNGSVSPDGLTISKAAEDRWSCFVSQYPLVGSIYVEFRIDVSSMFQVMLGIALANPDPQLHLGVTDRGMGLYLSREIVSFSGSTRGQYNRRTREGDVIGQFVDLASRRIAYFINDVRVVCADFPAAWGVDEPIFVGVSLSNAGDTVTMIPRPHVRPINPFD